MLLFSFQLSCQLPKVCGGRGLDVALYGVLLSKCRLPAVHSADLFAPKSLKNREPLERSSYHNSLGCLATQTRPRLAQRALTTFPKLCVARSSRVELTQFSLTRNVWQQDPCELPFTANMGGNNTNAGWHVLPPSNRLKILSYGIKRRKGVATAGSVVLHRFVTLVVSVHRGC